MSNPNGPEEPKIVNWLIPSAIVLIVLLVLATIILVPHFYGTPKSPGTFGDMFGGANAVFSGLAFAGLLYAILLQRRELALQREELKQTRSELRGQKEQMRAQHETLSQQRFENTFFQLLRLQSNTVSELDLRSGGKVTESGRDCFSVFVDRVHRGMHKEVKQQDRQLGDPALLEEVYRAVFGSIEADVGHYFRHLERILGFLRESTPESQSLYADLVRAQLSSVELLMVYYHCLAGPDREALRELAESYGLFADLNTDRVITKDLVGFLNPSAFACSPGPQG